MARTAEQDNVRELQRTLYRAAKADPGRRFHALHDKVVPQGRLGAGVGARCAATAARPASTRPPSPTSSSTASTGCSASWPPTSGTAATDRWPPAGCSSRSPAAGERRPLSIPAVRDRIVQAAARIVLEPIFEADFLPCSFGFRPRRAAHDALQVLVDEAWKGRRWVVETDIANCFEAIPHDRLMQAIEERVCDRHVLKLLRALLRAGVMQDGAVRRSVAGTPQGGVISPLLANVYLDRLDRAWQTRGRGSARPLRRRPRGDVPDRTGGRARPGRVAVDPGRARPGAEGSQDADRAPARRRGRHRLPRLRASLGARPRSRGIGTSPSSLAGPHAGPCSTPAIASVS